MSKMGQELEKRLDKNKYEMYGALRELAEGKGKFSMDRLTHAENTIEDMKELARGILAKIEGGG